MLTHDFQQLLHLEPIAVVPKLWYVYQQWYARVFQVVRERQQLIKVDKSALCIIVSLLLLFGFTRL